jgi:hypothetical protein
MTTKQTSKQTKPKKKDEPLTLEKRVARIERALQFLGAKLRTHGIHLEPEPEVQPEAEEGEGV